MRHGRHPDRIDPTPAPRSTSVWRSLWSSQSLLRQRDGTDGEPRFAMLETIREYALERLAGERRGGAARGATRRTSWPGRGGRAEAARPRSRSPGWPGWRPSTTTCGRRWPGPGSADRAEPALRLAGALRLVLVPPRPLERGAALAGGGAGAAAADGAARRRAREGAGRRGAAGVLPGRLSRPRARGWTRASPSAASGRTRRRCLRAALLGAGRLLHADHAGCARRPRGSVALFRAAGDRWGLATALCYLGHGRHPEPDDAAAARRSRRAWRCPRAGRHLGARPGAPLRRGGGAVRRRRDGPARSTRRAWPSTAELGPPAHGGHRAAQPGLRRPAPGEPAARSGVLRGGPGRHAKHGDRQNIGHCLGGLAGMVALLGHAGAAARLFGAAAGSSRASAPRSGPSTGRLRRATGGRARATGGGGNSPPPSRPGGSCCWSKPSPKQSPSRDDIGAVTQSEDAAVPASGLTRRELEILRLLTQRATDREIAGRLSISPRTVMHHVSRILAKLGVANRRDAAVWAAERGLT